MDENSKTVEQVAISLQDIKNYIGTKLTPLHSITANLQNDNGNLMNGMFQQAQVISALEAKLEDTKKLLANAISKKFHSLKSELAVNSMSQTNIAQSTIDQLSRKIHDCNTDIDEVYKGINKQAGRLNTVMHNLKQKRGGI